MTSVRPKLKPDVLKSITAWNTRTGRSVWLTKSNDWSEDISEAVILKGDDAERALEKARHQQSLIVEPYFMEVSDDGRPAGRETLREQIRVQGPSIPTFGSAE